MKAELANRLMQRPEACRWVVVPSPNNKNRVAGLMLALNGDIATVIDDNRRYKKPWQVKLADMQYR